MRLFVFVVLFFFFVVDGWCDCMNFTIESSTTSLSQLSYTWNYSSSNYPRGSFSWSGKGKTYLGTIEYTSNVNYDCSGGHTSGYDFLASYSCEFRSSRDWYGFRCSVLGCTDSCAAMEQYCHSQGLAYDADSCKCKMPCPENVCDAYKAQCEQVLQGSFTGRCERSGAGGEPCCNGYCDICSGSGIQGNYNEMKKICCGQYKAPPAIGNVCWQNPAFSSGCHVYQSTVRAPEGEQWACHDPNQSQEMMNRYVKECFGGSSSSTGGSSDSGGSSGGGNSSDEGGGGSSGGTPPYPEGCDECPWLDSILDTLTAQKSTVDQIYTCIKYPSLCDANSINENTVEIDSNILNGVKELIDSSLSLSNDQLEALLKLDTNMLKLLKLDSLSLVNDTLTRMSILSSAGDIQSSIAHLNDTTKKWLRRLGDSLSAQNDSNIKYLQIVADSVGLSAESLKVHLDSIKNAIPKDILDSILKYQKERSNDSIVISGLPGLDSLIDTTVHYWQTILHNDSLFHKDNNDSIRSIHGAIDGIGNSIGYALGYGDTASSSLRQDLLNIRDSLMSHIDSINLNFYDTSTTSLKVEILTDSVVKYFQLSRQFDSLYKLNFNDSIRSIHGAIDGIGNSIGHALGYGDTASSSLRQDLGGLKSSIDRIGDMFEGSPVDTSGLGVWGTYLENGVIKGDSIVSSYGWHNLNGINVDSNYSAALAGMNNKTDSIASVVDDSLSNLAGRLNDSLVRLNTSLKQKLPDTLTKYADSLVVWAPFADFDSIIYSTLGTRIPNTDECPEDCQKWSMNIPVIGLVNYTVDFGLCLGRASLGNLSVLAFLKLLIRIIVAITCVMIIYRALIGLK